MTQRGLDISNEDHSWKGSMDATMLQHNFELIECEANPCLCKKGPKYESKSWMMLVCDGCGSNGLHLKCASFSKVPEEDWLCQPCSLGVLVEEANLESEVDDAEVAQVQADEDVEEDKRLRGKKQRGKKKPSKKQPGKKQRGKKRKRPVKPGGNRRSSRQTLSAQGFKCCACHTSADTLYILAREPDDEKPPEDLKCYQCSGNAPMMAITAIDWKAATQGWDLML